MVLTKVSITSWLATPENQGAQKRQGVDLLTRYVLAVYRNRLRAQPGCEKE
jgi:hypothetical protein